MAQLQQDTLQVLESLCRPGTCLRQRGLIEGHGAVLHDGPCLGQAPRRPCRMGNHTFRRAAARVLQQPSRRMATLSVPSPAGMWRHEQRGTCIFNLHSAPAAGCVGLLLLARLMTPSGPREPCSLSGLTTRPRSSAVMAACAASPAAGSSWPASHSASARSTSHTALDSCFPSSQARQ